MKTEPTNNPMLDGTREPVAEGAISVDIVHSSVKRFTQSVTSSETLVERAKEANAAIEFLSNNVKRSWCDFEDWVKEAIVKTRSYKIGLETESRQLTANLRDVREFFFDPNHAEQVKRLREFVDLCERLKALKESGFLDDVADTILKLSK